MKVTKEDLHESGRPLTKAEFVERIKNDYDFSSRFGELGPIYGSAWRNFEGLDQISELIDALKTNPDSRRLRVSAWQPHKNKDMVLPPCHTDFQIYTRELSIEEKEYQLEKTNCINDIENDRIIYGHDWEKYIQEQYEGIQSTQGIIIPTRAISLMWNQRSVNEKSAA